MDELETERETLEGPILRIRTLYDLDQDQMVIHSINIYLALVCLECVGSPCRYETIL